MVSANTLIKFILGVKPVVIDGCECRTTQDGVSVLDVWLHPLAKARTVAPYVAESARLMMALRICGLGVPSAVTYSVLLEFRGAATQQA